MGQPFGLRRNSSSIALGTGFLVLLKGKEEPNPNHQAALHPKLLGGGVLGAKKDVLVETKSVLKYGI
jgi:hypothetical protein